MYHEIYDNHQQYQYNDGRNPQTAFRTEKKNIIMLEKSKTKGGRVVKQTDKKTTRGPERI